MLFGEQVPVLGDQLTFYKVIGSNYRVAVEATRKYVSDHTYIYLDNHFQAEISDQTIEDLGRAFDEYYEKLVEAFAPVAMDVDGYPGIFYLLSELENSGGSYVAGYFWGGNEFRKVDVPESNEKEVLFLTTFGYDEANPEAWAERTKSTMAHELQHLINFTNRVPKIWNYDQLEQYETETWINEGLSMVAEDLVMNWDNSLLDEQRVIPYLENPAADSLCTWANQLADYAPAYMFMRYFVDRFGTGIIQDLLHSNQFGLASVVSASGEGSFIPLFRDWLTAVYVSCQDPAIKNEFQAYNYYQKDLSTLEASLNVEDFSAEISIPDTTGQFIVLDDLGLANEIRISMEGSSKFKLRVIMFPTAEASFNSCQFQLQKVR